MSSKTPYWKQQLAGKPLFPDIEWNKPEQRSRAGKLGIIGGNKLGFAGVAESYQVAMNSGVGEIRVILPDALRRTIPSTMIDVQFGATNPSGSLAKEAEVELKAMSGWADGILLAGDAGRNSETAILYENFIKNYTGPLTITRDAVDLVKNDNQSLVDRPNTTFVISFAQLQKLFQSVYYPKVLTFSMQLAHLVEALHKFTITYPVCIAVLHKEHLLVAFDGDVVTTEWSNPMDIWRGKTAARAASYLLWTPSKPLEAIATSVAV